MPITLALLRDLREERRNNLLKLPKGTRVRDVAEACRSAGLAFAWGGHVWKKRDLARWLTGPYARAVVSTGHARGGSSGRDARDARDARDGRHSSFASAPESGVQRVAAPVAAVDDDSHLPISATAIDNLLSRSRARLLDDLRRCWSWRHDGHTAKDMMDAGLVMGVIDQDGKIGYAPIDNPRMLLIDRVRSLFLADYLTRPRDYESFAVCPRCGSATFDFYIPSSSAKNVVARSHAAECASLMRQSDHAHASVTRRDTMPFGLTTPPPPRVAMVGAANTTNKNTNTNTLAIVAGDEDDEIDVDISCFDLVTKSSAVEIEVVGEEEIDMMGIEPRTEDDDDFDLYGNLRDTLIDPIDTRLLFA